MKKLHIAIFGLVSLLPLPSFGIKAKPGVIDYRQPDGSVVKAIVNGDEHFHYVTSPDGFLLLENAEGALEYAVESESGIPVVSGVDARKAVSEVTGKTVSGTDYAKRFSTEGKGTRSEKMQTRAGEAKYRYSTSAFPTSGTPHSLVILVEYPDYGFNVSNPNEYFNDFLNGENFRSDGATGSVRKYYSENSWGAFVPTFDVYGPVMLENNRRYYGGGINEPNANQMVVEAIHALDASVDFSKYDHNDDGYVDSVYVIYADKGEADGGPVESVWPYSWELEEEGVFLEADGVKFNTYGVSNELQSDGEIEGIGTFTHEFGHVLGLPDLYNTDRSSDRTTPEDWSLMDSGSYLNDCRTPPNLSSFERYSLGWIDPKDIYCSGSYSLDNLATSNAAFIVHSEEKEDEFYIFENRQLEGWDAYLPNHGMLVWHIDFVQPHWDKNNVNNIPGHQYVELVRADNEKSISNLEADSFPGKNGVTSFTNTGEPALISWKGSSLNVTSIFDITENGGIISFSAETMEDRTPAEVESIPGGEMEIRIEGNTVYVSSGSYTVYDVAGRKAGIVSQSNPLPLPQGLYILAGKKILITN